MRETCDHQASVCWLKPPLSWGIGFSPPTPAELEQLHRKEEAKFKAIMDEINDNAAEHLSETSTQVDPEEQEDFMNDCPSPTHKYIRFWNPEYEARRQARKRLWSPPFTPEPGASYPRPSLQPSQRAATPVMSHRSPSPFPWSRRNESPPSDSAHQPPMRSHPARQKVSKATRSVPAHRPLTRSMKLLKPVALSNHKGRVVVGSSKDKNRHIASFQDFAKHLQPWSVTSVPESRVLPKELLTRNQMSNRYHFYRLAASSFCASSTNIDGSSSDLTYPRRPTYSRHCTYRNVKELGSFRQETGTGYIKACRRYRNQYRQQINDP
ncbi:MAG: hypothetical protein Q9209_007911 [Squamulea sp. 1 TL-2023]